MQIRLKEKLMIEGEAEVLHLCSYLEECERQVCNWFANEIKSIQQEKFLQETFHHDNFHLVKFLQ